jgi:serine/threonine protein kinase
LRQDKTLSKDERNGRLKDIERRKNEAITQANVKTEVTYSGQAFDTWGLGVLIFEMLTKSPPFTEPRPEMKPDDSVTTQQKEYRKLQTPEQRKQFLFGPNSLVPEDLKDIAVAMMHPEPAKRLTPAQAVQEPAFQQLGVGSPETYQAIVKLAQAD